MNKEEIEKHRRFLIELNKEQLLTIKKQKEKIDKAIEYIKNNREIRTFYTPEQRWEEKKDFIKGYYDLLEILGDKENE
jgi:hypothetical protein